MTLNPNAIVEEYIDDAPVDLPEIADRFGIPVAYDRHLLPDVSGKICRDELAPSGFRIIINANHHHRRQRFTLAHELAHFMLHRDLIDHVVDNEMYRSNLSNDLEKQANRYAAKLLLPAQAIRREYRHNSSLYYLADRFDVSEDAMRIRLSELGLG